MTEESSSSLTTNYSSKQPLRWLITGGCGFIGRNLIQKLFQEGGHQIRVLDNLSVGTREDLEQICDFREFGEFTKRSDLNCKKQSSFIELAVGDIRDYNLCLTCCKDIDVVVHLAANTGVGPSVENPRKDMEVNVIGTLNMLEAARQNNVKRFVFASSGASVGENEPPIHEEIVPHPISPYGASKLAGEGYCSAYFKTYGIETVVLRFGNVYGPLSGQKNSVVAKFIKRVIRGKPIEIFGDGKQTRDFIYIDDLIRALRLSVSKNLIGGEIFQIATSKETTVSKLTEKLIPILAESGYENIKIHHIGPRLGDLRRNFSDTSKALKHLGWQTEIELFEGLKRTLKWFIKNNF